MKVTELIATFQRFRSSQTEGSIGPVEPGGNCRTAGDQSLSGTDGLILLPQDQLY